MPDITRPRIRAAIGAAFTLGTCPTPIPYSRDSDNVQVVDSQAIRANAPGHTMGSVATAPLNLLPTADLGELRDPVLAVPAV